MKIRRCRITALMLSAALLLGGCGSTAASGGNSGNNSAGTDVTKDKTKDTADKTKKAPEIEGLTYESTMDLTYATEFDVYYYKDGYKLIDVHEDKQYLIVPEGEEEPENLADDIVVIQQPTENIYMAATASMSLFDAIGGIDKVKFSGLEASGWYVESAKEAMESGAMTFAGKYSEPDYETLVDGDCDLAIESTMILHTPKVQEMIEDLGIPVFVDYSSYESHPLGRTEWIKLYGALLNKEEEADTFFDQQAHVIEELKGFEKIALNPGESKTVTFELGKRAWAYYDVEGHDWYTEEGDFRILIGASSRDIRLSETVHVTPVKAVPRTYTMSACIGDLLNCPEIHEDMMRLKEICDSMFNSEENDSLGESTKAMMEAQTREMPLKSIPSMSDGKVTLAELEAMLSKVNHGK